MQRPCQTYFSKLCGKNGKNGAFLSANDTNSAQAIVAYDWIRYSGKSNAVYGLINTMTTISEIDFVRIVDGIDEDRDLIIRHNPIGTPTETLLWMLMSCLVSYLSLSDDETPCFTGRPDAETYKEAILFILRDRKEPDFEPTPYLERIFSSEN